MSDFPKISIVTVNYNGAEYLERTIKSVLDQRYPNLEYIIIDGGSTDNSIEIIRKYESRLVYWKSEPDQGMYDALQKGFKKTTGEIMGWINSDDLFHQNAFFRVAEIFSDYPQIHWLTGIPTAIDEKDNVMVPKFDNFPMWSKLRFYSGDYKWIQQESTLWKRDLWLKSGDRLDTALKYGGDFHLWLRFFRHEKLYVAPILIGGFRMRRAGQQSIDNKAEYMKEVRMCFRKEVSLLACLLMPVNIFDRVMISIPVIKKIYYKSGLRRLLGFPSRLEFDPKLQRILLN
jgi:glycosyltransferase involved in cell wall biosynthesis